MPVVRAAGSTGGTVTVKRSRAMVVVSLEETWGGRDIQVNSAEQAGTLSGTISCNTAGALEIQSIQSELALGEAESSLRCA